MDIVNIHCRPPSPLQWKCYFRFSTQLRTDSKFTLLLYLSVLITSHGSCASGQGCCKFVNIWPHWNASGLTFSSGTSVYKCTHSPWQDNGGPHRETVIPSIWTQNGKLLVQFRKKMLHWTQQSSEPASKPYERAAQTFWLKDSPDYQGILKEPCTKHTYYKHLVY